MFTGLLIVSLSVFIISAIFAIHSFGENKHTTGVLYGCLAVVAIIVFGISIQGMDRETKEELDAHPEYIVMCKAAMEPLATLKDSVLAVNNLRIGGFTCNTILTQ